MNIIIAPNAIKTSAPNSPICARKDRRNNATTSKPRTTKTNPRVLSQFIGVEDMYNYLSLLYIGWFGSYSR